MTRAYSVWPVAVKWGKPESIPIISHQLFGAILSRHTPYAISYMLLQAITARGFLHCQPGQSGMERAFPRRSWCKVKPRSVRSSPSASSWSSPIRSRHSNRLPHPHPCPQGPCLLDQPSPSFAVLAISAGSQTHGQEVTFVLIDVIERKHCVRTRARREPIARWTKPSSRHYLDVHSCLQKFRKSGTRKQEGLLSN